jgi:hypothetical protein
MRDRSPTGSGEVIVAGDGGAVTGTCDAVAELGGAVIETAADAVGSFAR